MSDPTLPACEPNPTSTSADIARHALQRPAPHGGSWSTTAAACACETWLEECEGHYQDCLFRAGAEGLLGRTWVFALRRNLTIFQKLNQSVSIILRRFGNRSPRTKCLDHCNFLESDLARNEFR